MRRLVHGTTFLFVALLITGCGDTPLPTEAPAPSMAKSNGKGRGKGLENQQVTGQGQGDEQTGQGKGQAGKVGICHAPPGNPEKTVTIWISAAAVAAHAAHGDNVEAPCGLAGTASISGTVTAADVAVAGAVVTLSGDADLVATTDETGAYGFVDLNSGSYTVTVTADGYTFDPNFLDVELAVAEAAVVDFAGVASGG